jgi:uncharacterized membrane protein YhaH (DUF805 family)
MANFELKKIAEKQTAQIIKKEIDKKNYEDTAWLKALKKAKGNETEAVALYIEIREDKLIEEIYLSLVIEQNRKIEEAEWYRNEKNKILERKNERKNIYEKYAEKKKLSDSEKKKLIEKHVGSDENENQYSLKKKPPLTEYEKQQIRNNHLEELKNIRSVQSSNSNDSDFFYYIGKCFGKYAVFEGVAEKAEFWWFYLFFTILSVATYFIDLNLMNSETGFGIFSGIALLILFFPMTSVSTRRLHDIGKSGWWQLIALTGVGLILLVVWYATDTNNKLNSKFK